MKIPVGVDVNIVLDFALRAISVFDLFCGVNWQQAVAQELLKPWVYILGRITGSMVSITQVQPDSTDLLASDKLDYFPVFLFAKLVFMVHWLYFFHIFPLLIPLKDRIMVVKKSVCSHSANSCARAPPPGYIKSLHNLDNPNNCSKIVISIRLKILLWNTFVAHSFQSGVLVPSPQCIWVLTNACGNPGESCLVGQRTLEDWVPTTHTHPVNPTTLIRLYKSFLLANVKYYNLNMILPYVHLHI